MGIKLKITLAFSTVFILLSLFLSFFGYQHIHTMLILDNLSESRLTDNLRQLRTLLGVIVIVSILLSVTLSSVLARLLLLPLQVLCATRVSVLQVTSLPLISWKPFAATIAC